jgi:hypothetical protein
MDEKLYVSVKSVALSEANMEIANLRTMLEDNAIADGASEHLRVRGRLKESKETQDFGATLILVLGTPAVLAVAKGIYEFIAKTGSHVVVRTPEGEVVARGGAADNIDIAATAEALKGHITVHGDRAARRVAPKSQKRTTGKKGKKGKR